jgi:toxin CcdB
MARFDIYALNRAEVPYVLEVQADLLSDLASVVVVPLVPADSARAETMRKLKPEITIKGQSFCLMTTDIGTLRRASLGKPVVNVEEQYRAVIVDALDFLFQGF